jgi:lipoyl(octanoyl) transferase
MPHPEPHHFVESVVNARWLGRRRYAPVLELQRLLFEQRKHGHIADTVLFVEHEPSITLGRGARAEHLLTSAEQLNALGIELHKTDRGGDITVHAPGQLVCYPIVDLNPARRDVRRYVQMLTDVMRQLVLSHGIDAGTLPGKIGLWADAHSIHRWPGPDGCIQPVKLGAVGVRISRWVTMHGFALNLFTDLTHFQWIVPCGIADLGVASVQSLTGKQVALEATARQAHQMLSAALDKAVGAFEVQVTSALGPEV